MMVVYYATGQDRRWNFLRDLWDGLTPVIADDLRDFVNLLYRDPDAIGLLNGHLPDMTVHIVGSIRLGGLKNRLLVLIPSDVEHHVAARQRGDVLFIGADDAQPNSIDEIEVVSRAKALGRRGEYIDHLRIELPGAVFHTGTRTLEAGTGRGIRVRPGGTAILVDLARHPGQTRTKQQLMDAIYGDEDGPDIKIIDVLVCHLRRQIIESTGGLDCIRTIWGQGFQFIPEGFTPEYRTDKVRAPR